jgi:DUF4097 and DUF4098 domain-containing protein YvlB
MRNLCFAVAAVAVVALTVPSRAAFEDTDKVSKTLKLAPGGTLRLNSFSGRVTITPNDKDEVTIDAVRHGDRDWLDRYKLEIYSEGSSTVVVKENQRDNSSWFSWSRRNRVVETDFDIKVPRKTDLNVQVFSAAVNVTGIEGSHRVHTFSSRVRLDDVSGNLKGHSFSGGWVIREKTWGENQTIDVDTFSGSVELHVPENARGRVTFNSFSGHLNSELPLTLNKGGRRSLDNRYLPFIGRYLS